MEGDGGSAFLVLRRGGAHWALPWQEVRGVARHGTGGGGGGAGSAGAGGGSGDPDGSAEKGAVAGGFEVRVAAGCLAADEVLGVVPEMRLHPAGAALRRFWPEAVRGLAVHGRAPVVLIDPQAPPRQLLTEGPGGMRDVEEGEHGG